MMCPECLDEMIHQMDHMLDDKYKQEEYHCSDCLIDVQKLIEIEIRS